ncbi:hypothetical protein [Phnomibacter ginsenosidimutans]|nr:hypothetical protein [Phnomibacter ginsenosidimutans]
MSVSVNGMMGVHAERVWQVGEYIAHAIKYASCSGLFINNAGS